MHNCDMQLNHTQDHSLVSHCPIHCRSFALHATVYHYFCHVPSIHVQYVLYVTVSQVACCKIALALTASLMQDLTNWEGFRRTKRRKCWRAFPCSDLAASGILLWPASTLQVGLRLINVVHSPRCIQMYAFTQMHSLRCIYLASRAAPCSHHAFT